jgi:chromosome segregation protein
MYLERISIYGFKTFRKETEILLSPKITCIVGPNGSGKSNIVDGIRWALGEQRLSLLRATESTDLIFSGSAFKKPLSVASVKLVFNNEDRTFPNVNTPRVVVERRIYRSKESGYFVNNNSMRLQDVMGLFYSAGMYNHMYSIVSQGRIEEILLAKPEQKRALIEQVAGVEVFKKKRREALKKLNETEQNLLRVKDNLSELKKRVDRIASESKKAHMYYFLNDRLKQLESTLLNYLLSSLNRQIETLKSGIMDIENEEKILLEKIRSKKEELEKLEKKQENLLKEFEKMRNKKEAMLIEEAKLKEREVFLEDKKNKAEEQIKENNLSIEKNRRKAGYINNDIENLKKNEEEANKEIVERQQGIEKLKAEIEEIEREIIPLLEEEKKSKEDRSILQEKRLKKERILSSIKSEINYLQKEKSRIEFIVKNAENLEIENIAELQNQIFSISNLISEKQREKESISEETALIKYKISEIKNLISAHSVKGRGFRNGTLGSTLNNVEIKNGIEEELNAFILKNR